MTGRVDPAEAPETDPPGATRGCAADLDQDPGRVERAPRGRLGAELREQLVDPVLGELRVDLAGQPGRELGIHAMHQGLLRLSAPDPADGVVRRPGPGRRVRRRPPLSVRPSRRDTPSNSASAASRSTGSPGGRDRPRPARRSAGPRRRSSAQKLCTSVRCQRRSAADQSGQEGTRAASGTPARTSRNRRAVGGQDLVEVDHGRPPYGRAGRRIGGAAQRDTERARIAPASHPTRAIAHAGGRSTLGP